MARITDSTTMTTYRLKVLLFSRICAKIYNYIQRKGVSGNDGGVRLELPRGEEGVRTVYCACAVFQVQRFFRRIAPQHRSVVCNFVVTGTRPKSFSISVSNPPTTTITTTNTKDSSMQGAYPKSRGFMIHLLCVPRFGLEARRGPLGVPLHVVQQPYVERRLLVDHHRLGLEPPYPSSQVRQHAVVFCKRRVHRGGCAHPSFFNLVEVEVLKKTIWKKRNRYCRKTLLCSFF